MCLFDVNEYNEDLKHERLRTKSVIKNNPYVNDYLRKMQDPEYGISYIKCLISFHSIYLFLSISYYTIEELIMVINWCNALTTHWSNDVVDSNNVLTSYYLPTPTQLLLFINHPLWTT